MSGRLLRESIQLDAGCTVDESAGVVRNVRVLGAKSPNCHGVPGVTAGTEYTRTAMESACKLYEENTVYADHPDRSAPHAERKITETLGVLRGNRVAEGKDGPEVRADLHFYTSHPTAPQLIEDVNRKLGRFGLSHNAVTGKASVREGRYIVESLSEVRSIDLVNRAATNRNLWESREVQANTTLRQVLEARKDKLGPVGRALLEDHCAPMMDAPVADAPADHNEAVDQAFVGAMKALIDGYASGELADADMLKKLKQLVKAHCGVKDGSEPAEDEPEDAEKDDMNESIEALKQENSSLRYLLEHGQGVKLKPAVLKAFMLLESDDDRKELLESYRTAGVSAVRSTVPGNVPSTVTESKTPTDAKSFAALITE